MQSSELPQLEPAVVPACRNLRSKGMYVSGTLNPAVDDGTMGDGYCWCSKTQFVKGPDGKYVQRKLCLPDRTCFEAIL